MFVLCPHCQFLVATDPVSGQPPSLCPRCAEPLLVHDASDSLPPFEEADVLVDPAHDGGRPQPALRADRRTDNAATAAAADPVVAAPSQTDADTGQAGQRDERDPGSAFPSQAPHDAAAAAKLARARLEAMLAEATLAAAKRPEALRVEAKLASTPVEPKASQDSPAADHVDPEDAPVRDESADVSGDARHVTVNLRANATKEPPAGPEGTEQAAPGVANGATHDIEPRAEAAPEPILEPDQYLTQEPPPEDIEPAGAIPASTAAATAAFSPVPPPAKRAPSFVRRPAAASGVAPKRGGLTVAAIGVLTLALLLQLLLADRAQLAANARWRPAMSALCSALHCTLPPWREPDAFSLQQRDVRPHPTIPGALRVSATFRNDARWPQPWPGLLLTLSDIDGRTLGARTFTAQEYLAADERNAPAQTQKTLASGQSVTISMDVIEPTPRIVAFTFEFE